MIADWNHLAPSRPLRIATLGDYLDAIQPRIRNQQPDLPVAVSSRKYGWPAFWVNVPKVKQRYRRAEHQLQAAEALATIASVTTKLPYPAQDLANGWFLMALNMDRNILWGAGVDDSFRDSKLGHRRPFQLRRRPGSGSTSCRRGCVGGIDPNALTLFNPLSWERRDPLELRLPDGKSPIGFVTQTLPDGQTLAVLPNLQAMEVRAAKLAVAPPSPAVPARVPSSIANPHYEARIDPMTGVLTSVRLKPSGREVLGGPANRVVAEAKSDVHNLPEKSLRTPLAESGQYPAEFSVVEGPIATVVEIRSVFPGPIETPPHDSLLPRFSTDRFRDGSGRPTRRGSFSTRNSRWRNRSWRSDAESPTASRMAPAPEHATCRALLPESLLQSGSPTIRRPAVAAWQFWIAAFPAGS